MLGIGVELPAGVATIVGLGCSKEVFGMKYSVSLLKTHLRDALRETYSDVSKKEDVLLSVLPMVFMSASVLRGDSDVLRILCAKVTCSSPPRLCI